VLLSQASIVFVPSLPTEYQIVSKITTVPTKNISTFYSEYEAFILKIIQYIIDKVSLDTVIQDIAALQKEIQTVVEAEHILNTIETIMLTIVDNIAAGIDINLILNRITYLKQQLALATDLPVVYSNAAELIGYVIDQITNKEPLDNVLTNLIAIQTAMVAEVQLAKEILDIQNIIITIIENVIQAIDINLILNRITYLQGLIKAQFK
jgi:hypothetical protein